MNISSGCIYQKISSISITAIRNSAASILSQNLYPEIPENTFYHRDLKIIRSNPVYFKSKPFDCGSLKFGHVYADHMLEVDWNENMGWSQPAISMFHNLSLHSGSEVFHHSIELYEGLKAYRGVDNKIRIFRPDKNMERMKSTAKRASLPDFNGDELIKIIFEMVKLDKEWVPYSDTSSLYIRPAMIGTDPMSNSQQAKLFVVSSPVGAYYQKEFEPVSLLADPNFIRSFPGGVGYYKMGCNYAPTIMIGKIANENGCHQALWLFGDDEKLTEVGTMNIFVYWINEQGEEELCTPPLTDGLILAGITRDSILEIARKWNEFKISERYPTMEEIKQALRQKRLFQIFGTGTACVIAPVDRILYKNRKTQEYENLRIPSMEAKNNLIKRFYHTILDIQYGRMEWPGWTSVVC